MDMETLLLNIGAAKKVNSETKPTNAGMLFFGALGVFLGLMLKAISRLISRNGDK